MALLIADVKIAIIGADFLAHFGLMIDIKGGRLIDSVTIYSTQGRIRQVSLHGVSTVDEHMGFTDILNEFIDITRPLLTPRTATASRVAHHIVTSGPPVAKRPRRLTGEKLTTARVEIEFLLEHGIIRPSSSPWGSPIQLVTKKQVAGAHVVIIEN